MGIINRTVQYGVGAQHYVAQNNEKRFVKINKISLILILVLFLLCLIFSCGGGTGGNTLNIRVMCGGVEVGFIHLAVSGSSIRGHFRSTSGNPPSLEEAAALCNEHHFNWYQIVKTINNRDLSSMSDGDGDKLAVPFVDPPPGGYREKNIPTKWADQLPWIYNEGYPPPDGTPGFDDMMLDDMLKDNIPFGEGDNIIDMLRFEDKPKGHPSGTRIRFHTWLVSLNEDGSFHSWHDGFSWTWTCDRFGNETISNLERLDHDPKEEEYDHITGKFSRRKPVSVGVDDEGHVTWGGDFSDKKSIAADTPYCGGYLIFYWTTGQFDKNTKTGAKHPGYAPFSLDSKTQTWRFFHCPDDETITDWRYEKIDTDGSSVVRGGNIQRNSSWEFHPIRELPDVYWRIPNLSPLEGRDSTLGIFTAVNLDVYLANNPLGFLDGEWAVGQTLNELKITIVDGKINGLKGIYFATTDFTFNAVSETGWVPIGGSDAWLNSDDFQIEHGEVGVLAENGIRCQVNY